MSMFTDSQGRGIGTDNPLPVQSMQKKFRDSFTTPNLNTDKWIIVSQGAGQTISQAGGVLTLGAGTTANEELIIESKDCYTIPLRLMFGIMLSQRIANQDISVEMISIDEDMQTHPYNEAHICAWKFNGTTATTGLYEVSNNGLARLSASGTITTTASYAIKEIEMFSDEVWFHDRVLDSTAGRNASWVRQQQIPDPNLHFRIRIRITNGAVAPASNTTVSFQYITLMDYIELTTEITASRGGQSGGMGMPVNVSSGTISTVSLANVRQLGAWKEETVTNLGASATFTGTGVTNGTTSVLYASKIRVRVYASHAGTLYIEQSKNTTVGNYRCPTGHSFAVGAGECIQVEVPAISYYYRIRYVNGAIAQTSFEILSALVGV